MNNSFRRNRAPERPKNLYLENSRYEKDRSFTLNTLNSPLNRSVTINGNVSEGNAILLALGCFSKMQVRQSTEAFELPKLCGTKRNALAIDEIQGHRWASSDRGQRLGKHTPFKKHNDTDAGRVECFRRLSNDFSVT